MFSASTLISALQLVSFAKVARLMNPDIPPGKISLAAMMLLVERQVDDFLTVLSPIFVTNMNVADVIG